MAARPIASTASPVLPPMCGVPMKVGSRRRSASSGGSNANTSAAAPAIRLSTSARFNAASSTMPPRAVLMRNASASSKRSRARRSARGSTHRAGCAPRRCRSRGAAGRARGLDVVRAIEIAVGRRCRGRARVEPNARQRRATVCPTWPQPTMPIVADEICRRRGRSPHAAAQIGGQRNEAAAERDHERDRELGDRLPVHAGRPAHDDSVSACGVEVDHVETDAVLAHEPKLGHGAEHRRVEHVQAGDGSRVAVQEPRKLAARSTRSVSLNLAPG